MSLPLLSRRALNRAALAWALGVLAAPRRAPAQSPPRWEGDPFTLGVASGQPRADSVVLWTRLAPDSWTDSARIARQSCQVCYEMYSDAGLRTRVAQGAILTDAARAHSVHVLAQGLAPGRAYWYRFVCGDAASPVGRTRTAPAADAPVPRLRLALAACQHYEQGFFAAQRDIAEHELDAVLFVGDYVYEGATEAARALRHHGTPTPHTLDEYRARHALYKRDPDLQAAHAAHPWILTWDDHEVVNDYADDRDPAWTEPQRFLRRRAAAYRAYFEHMPLALPPQGAAMRIHDHFAWGRLADIWTLDCRQYRSHHACPDPAHDAGRSVLDCAELADPARSMLGSAQEAWLAKGLAASQRQWQLLGQSTQIAPAGIDTPQGRRVWTDGWDGYPAARQRLLQTVADARLQNVIALSGDVHRHVAANLRMRAGDAATPVLASEFVGGSVTSHGASPAAMARMRENNPDIVHARGDERGWTLLDVAPDGAHCTMRSTPHPAQDGARLHTQARFVVAPGQAGVQAA